MLAGACESLPEEETCNNATGCMWLNARYFPGCQESCGAEQIQGICAAAIYAETGCYGLCNGRWRVTQGGIYVVDEGPCFRDLQGWQDCSKDHRPECDCCSEQDHATSLPTTGSPAMH